MDHYPISDEARERINIARVRQGAFKIVRLLEEGGYSRHEINAILDVIMPFMMARTFPAYDDIVKGLRSRGFSKENAVIVAQGFAER